MRTIYNLLHFHHKTPKRLLLSIPDTVPDLTKEEGIVLSVLSEDNSQSFALSTGEISDFIVALTYARRLLKCRRLAALNAKYSTKKEDIKNAKSKNGL